jgi:ATP-dependent DNA helicase RecG
MASDAGMSKPPTTTEMLEAARLQRERMAAAVETSAAQEADEPEPTRAQLQRARAGRAASRALGEHRKAPRRPMERPVETLKGVGANVGAQLRLRGLSTLGDLVWCLPLGYEDERTVTPMSEVEVGQRVVTEGVVAAVRGGGYGRGRRAEVTLEGVRAGDGGIPVLRLVWFRAPPGLLTRFVVGDRYRVAGQVEEYRGFKQITHPDTQRLGADQHAAGRGIVARYPSVPGVPPRRFASLVQGALQVALADVDEAVPQAVLQQHGLGSLGEALHALHTPPSDLSEAEMAAFLEGRSPQHLRLAFEEFFLLELSLFVRRIEEQGIAAEALCPPGDPLARVRDALGFPLTSAQQRVVREITQDLQSERPMRRLLQGDVGSGKTAVAMLAAAHCIASGAQVAFMAPTEVLAGQHFRSLEPLAKALGLRAALMLGGERASHRKKSRKALEEGKLDLVVGTHALLSEGVRFARLRLCIVDEQHRFGVGQRLRLVDKGSASVAPHLLVMTATPIPRTLALALHGDLQSSVIDEMPAGRVPPTTRAYTIAERDSALAQLERALQADGQAYVVCPAIEEDPELGLRSAEQTFAELSQRFASYGVDLLHGRLSDEAKVLAMERFVSGASRVLVATTIIEVGIDVRRANVILIEHAERFGLAQLHQLRGRVGRGGQRSACLLVHEAASEESRARMRILCETSDGFRIAEEDLQLRGPGELFGRRQSGLPGFRFGDLRRDTEWLERARQAAEALMACDPHLDQPAHAGARAAIERFQQGVRAVVKEEAG